MTTRREARASFADDVRIDLIEDDLDKHDSSFEQFRIEQRKTNQILISILVALVSASILLALNAMLIGGR